MTSEFDTPQGIISTIINENSKDTPNREAIVVALTLISDFISSIHSFAHEVDSGKLKLKCNYSIGTVKLPKTAHFLRFYPETAYVLKKIEGLKTSGVFAKVRWKFKEFPSQYDLTITPERYIARSILVLRNWREILEEINPLEVDAYLVAQKLLKAIPPKRELTSIK